MPEDVRDKFNINPDMSSHGADGPIDVAYSQHFYSASSQSLFGFGYQGSDTIQIMSFKACRTSVFLSPPTSTRAIRLAR